MITEFSAIEKAKEIEENASVEISLDDLLLIATAIQDAYETGLKDCLDIADQVVDDFKKGEE